MDRGKRNLFLLGALVLIAGALGSRILSHRGEDPLHNFANDVELCKQNQRALYTELVRTSRELGGLDSQLENHLQQDESLARELLNCPGSGGQSASAAYIFRDLDANPLESLPNSGSQALVVCDRAAGAGHGDVLNVLFADGSVRTLLLSKMIKRGQAPADATRIPIGPGAGYKLLAVFPADR